MVGSVNTSMAGKRVRRYVTGSPHNLVVLQCCYARQRTRDRHGAACGASGVGCVCTRGAIARCGVEGKKRSSVTPRIIHMSVHLAITLHHCPSVTERHTTVTIHQPLTSQEVRSLLHHPAPQYRTCLGSVWG